MVGVVRYEEVRRAINEIYQAPRNDYFELGLNAVSKKKKYATRTWALIKKCCDYLGGYISKRYELAKGLHR